MLAFGSWNSSTNNRNNKMLIVSTITLLAMVLTVHQSFGYGPYPFSRPGCHRLGYTRTMSIPGCVKFDMTTNACRGHCLSYAVPSVEDTDAPISGQDLIRLLGPDYLLEKGVNITEDENGFVIMDLLRPEDRDIIANSRREIISLGQCCGMAETEDVEVNVRCREGIRRLTFKSAKRCECNYCKRNL